MKIKVKMKVKMKIKQKKQKRAEIFFVFLENFEMVKIVREQRNHGLKYESDCVRVGTGIKI